MFFASMAFDMLIFHIADELVNESAFPAVYYSRSVGLHKLFWQIIPGCSPCASFNWGVSKDDFHVPFLKTRSRGLNGLYYFIYKGELLGLPCDVTYVFGPGGLMRIRADFVLARRKQRPFLVEKLFKGLCDIGGAPLSGALQDYYDQALLSWRVDNTSLVLAISALKVVLNIFPVFYEEPAEIDSELARLIDEMSLVLFKDGN